MSDAPPVDKETTLQLLGRPQLRQQATELDLGSRKALALLALLALDGTQPRLQLARWLWPDVAPEPARRNLRRELHRLRAAGVAIVDAPAAGLRLGEGLHCDATGWTAATVPAALPTLALGLDGVAGAEFDDWLARARERLARQFDACHRDAAQAALLRGDRAGALASQQARLGADPCNEAAALAAMEQLAALDERPAALALYERLRRTLREALDAAPGEALTRLAQSLRQTPPPAPLPVPSAASRRPGAAPFVRRPADEAAVLGAWARGRRVFVDGEPGIGKSRLARELAAARGPWLATACEPQDAGQPYASAVRALRLLHEAAPDTALPAWVRRELGALLPEWGPAPAPLDLAEARERLLAALAEAWLRWVQGNFNTVLLDDWQWCDAASLAVWERVDGLVPNLAWIIVHRRAELPAAASRWRHAQVDAGRAVAVTLHGLPADALHELARAAGMAADGPGLACLLEHTRGNPLFAMHTLQQLRDAGGTLDGLAAAGADAGLPIPPAVRQTLLARCRALGPLALRLLEAASLLPGELHLGLLQDVAPADADSVQALEHAAAAGLLEESGAAYRFSHALLRQCLAESLSAARRRWLHGRLAERLQAQAAAPALVAEQLEAAGQAADAVRWRMAAAEAAARVHALDDALAQYALALADGADAAQVQQIHLARAALHRRRLEPDAALAALDDAGRALADAGTPPLAATLALALGRADILLAADRIADAELLLDGLAVDVRSAPPALQARWLGQRGMLDAQRDRLEASRLNLEAAIATYAGLPGTRAERVGLLYQLGRLAFRMGRVEAVAELSERAQQVCEGGDLPREQAEVLLLAGVSHTLLGRRDAGLAALEQARALCRQTGDVPTHRAVLLNLIKVHTDAGAVAPAAALLAESEALAPCWDSPRAELAFAEARFYLHHLRGDTAPADAAARQLLALADAMPGLHERIGARMQVLDHCLLEGRLDEAAALLAQSQALGRELPADGGHGGLYRVQHCTRQAWLALGRQQPAEAARWLGQAAAPERSEDRFALAWLGAAVALQLDDTARARRCLAGVSLQDEVAVDQLALWLEQTLHLARRTACEPEAAAWAQAQALLAPGRLPPVLHQRLAQAAAAINAFSTPGA